MGGYFTTGGMYSLTKALFNLAEKKGVKFCFNSEVERIHLKNKTVHGIQVSGKFIPSAAVISNADVYLTYSRLLGDNKSRAAKKYKSLEPSSSALVFYWGVNIKSDDLETHNILFSADYENEFRELFLKKIYPSDPTVYIYISSKLSPGDAPDGSENWFVMINAPYADKNLNIPLESLKQTILGKIQRLTGYDIKDKIVCENIMTPFNIKSSTGSYKGSIYGISSNNRKAAFLRQPNRSKEYKGLYFCGGSRIRAAVFRLLFSPVNLPPDTFYHKNYFQSFPHLPLGKGTNLFSLGGSVRENLPCLTRKL